MCIRDSAAIVLLIWLLAGFNWTDPFGATTRETLRTKAQVEIARVEAQAQVETAKVEAQAAIQTTNAWTSTLPVLLLIVVGGTLAGIILYFRGKAYLIDFEHGTPLPLPDDEWRLRCYAARTNQRLSVRSGSYYLTDPRTGKRVRALPKATTSRDRRLTH